MPMRMRDEQKDRAPRVSCEGWTSADFEAAPFADVCTDAAALTIRKEGGEAALWLFAPCAPAEDGFIGGGRRAFASRCGLSATSSWRYLRPRSSPSLFCRAVPGKGCCLPTAMEGLMDKPFWQVDYEIEARCDWDGDFPLQCAAALFASLNLNSNIIIKKRYTLRNNESEVIRKYIDNDLNRFYRYSKHPDVDYCLWIKQQILTQQELIELLKLQGIYLSCIVPNDTFDWEDFLDKWEKDERYLLLSGQASFICNILDEDRRLNIGFNTVVYSMDKISNVLSAWEKSITHIAKAAKVCGTVTQTRSRYGDKQTVILCLS